MRCFKRVGKGSERSLNGLNGSVVSFKLQYCFEFYIFGCIERKRQISIDVGLHSSQAQEPATDGGRSLSFALWT
jgi:hypothetical protein